MKQFLIKILIFFFVWFAISSLVDIYITAKVRHTPFREFRLWEDIISSNINADIIFLGSSRTVHSYNPIIFDSILNVNSYNLGMYGKLIDMDFLCYQMYQKKNKRPNIIVWDIFQNTFDYSGRFKDYQYVPYLFNNNIWASIHNKYHNFNNADKYVPLYKYWRNSLLIQWAMKPPTNTTFYYKGFDFDSSTGWSPDHLTSIKDNSISCSYNQQLINQFESIIKEIKRKDIEVYLVFSPLYINGQSKIKDLDKYIVFINNIAQKNSCVFLNYLDDTICYDTSFFHNSEHLNYYGASIFSAKIAHFIDSIYNTPSPLAD